MFQLKKQLWTLAGRQVGPQQLVWWHLHSDIWSIFSSLLLPDIWQTSFDQTSKMVNNFTSLLQKCQKTVLEVKLWIEIFNVNTCEGTDFKITFFMLIHKSTYKWSLIRKSVILYCNKSLFSFPTDLAYSIPVDEIKNLIQKEQTIFKKFKLT